MFILQGAPSLQELCIKVWDHPCEMIVDGEQRRNYGFSKDKKDAYASKAPASDFKHHNLSVLRVFGFQCEEKVVNCVESVMKASAALEDVYLYEKPVCEYCKHTARKGIYVQRRSQLAMLANILDMGIISRVKDSFAGFVNRLKGSQIALLVTVFSYVI